MIETILLQQALGIFLCIVILARTEPALNRMGKEAPGLIRAAFVMLASASVAGILAILTGHAPGLETLLLAAGIALLLMCDRRIRILTKNRNQEKGLRHA